MNITVKIKYGCSKSLFESFGNNRYLVYLFSKENENPNEELISLISQKMGTPVGRIQIKQDKGSEKIIEVS
jgi:uncharacterized protein YggU (UPF0235/DUF167 family)